MEIKFNGIFIFFATSFFISQNALAQLSEADSSFYQSAISNTINFYHSSEGDQSPLYNGISYIHYPFRFREGTPYFAIEKPDTGSVYYDGTFYNKLLLIYNDLDDKLLTDDNGYLLELNKKKITAFTSAGHHFIRIEKNSINDIRPGFYEVLYSGTATVLKKTMKKNNEDLSNGQNVQHYISSEDHYYIQKDKIIYIADNKKETGGIFPDKKKEILQYIKKNKLNFRKDKENALIQIATYYAQIRK